MRAISLFVAGVAAFGLASAAPAETPDGKWQIKAFATAVLPTGDIKEVRFVSPTVAAALPANTDAKGTGCCRPTPPRSLALAARSSRV